MEGSRDKRFMLVGIVIFLLVILSSFLDSSHHLPPPSSTAPARTPVVYLDTGTGCEYLLLPGAALTPRMTANGHQMCIALPPVAAAPKGAGQGTPPAPPAAKPQH